MLGLAVVQRLPAPLLLRLGEGEPDATQSVLERQHPLGVCLRHGERPDLRSSQRHAVAAERIGYRPDVGAGADTQVERRDALCIRDDVERVDLRPPQRHLDHDALAVEAVRALTPDLDGRRRRDRKLDLAAEARERGLELGRRGRLVQLERLALRIARGRPPREIDGGEVALGQSDEA